MSTRLAFFDADCLEFAPSTGFLRMGRRVRPYRDKLCAIYNHILDGGYPLVFTTCCSGSMLPQDARPDILFVPLDPDQTEWKARLPFKRLIYLEKKTYHNAQKNFNCRAFDMFADNGNAASLVKHIAADEWILFGNGLDLCVNSAVTGVLRAGGKVTFLSDCMCSSATGYGPYGTPEYRELTFARWRETGAIQQTLDTFLARVRLETAA